MDNAEESAPRSVYTNCFSVGHNAFEFVFDFGAAAPEDTAPRMHTRLITSPMLAGAFAGLLEQSLREYEAENQTRLPRVTSPSDDEPGEG